MTKKHQYILIQLIYSLISIIVLISGYLYEDAYSSRQLTLLIIVWIYISTMLIEELIKKQQTKLKYLFIALMTLSVIVLEANSKYAINYFFHAIYILLMIYLIVIHTTQKKVILFASIITFSSFIKFIQLMIVQPTQGNIALFIFFFLIQVFILIITLFAKTYNEENRRTQILYKELQDAYKIMEDYSREIKALTMVEERTKIARDLHDTLGHDMTGLIMQIEMATRLLEKDDKDKLGNMLEESKKSARESLTTVRKIVDTLKSKEDMEWTSHSIIDLCNRFKAKTDITIECNINGEKNVKPDIGITLYRIVQEGLTNSVRHGEAHKVMINIEYNEQEVIFSIEDNGKGCKRLKKGNGINGMIERIRILQGDIEFINSNGFIIKGKIPSISQ